MKRWSPSPNSPHHAGQLSSFDPFRQRCSLIPAGTNVQTTVIIRTIHTYSHSNHMHHQIIHTHNCSMLRKKQGVAGVLKATSGTAQLAGLASLGEALQEEGFFSGDAV